MKGYRQIEIVPDSIHELKSSKIPYHFEILFWFEIE